MIPLAAELQRRGNEVIFGVDKSLIPLVRSELPGISITEIRGVHIRYSRHLPQYLCIFLQLPRIIVSSVREYYDLRRLASRLQPDLIISDSRFGFRHRHIRSVYVTHQLRIAFPKWLRLMEPRGEKIHRMIIGRFDLCLVPDYPGPANLSGRLSHDLPLPENVCYCGPLSRFRAPASPFDRTTAAVSPAAGFSSNADTTPGSDYGSAAPGTFASTSTPANNNASHSIHPGISSTASPTTGISGPAANTRTAVNPAATSGGSHTPPVHPFCCLILSGPEPQRSILLERVIAAVTEMPVVILSATSLQQQPKGGQKITIVTNPDTATMRGYLLHASRIIARAGYTTIMELTSLGRGAILIPTPGQTEQVYLGRYLHGRRGFVNVRQEDIIPASPMRHSCTAVDQADVSDRPADLFTNSNPVDGRVDPPGVASPDRNTEHAGAELPDTVALLERALDILLEKQEQ